MCSAFLCVNCSSNGGSFLKKRKILLFLLHQAEKLDVDVCVEKFISVVFKWSREVYPGTSKKDNIDSTRMHK